MAAMQASDEASGVLSFWRDAGPSRWFRRDEAFDAQLRERFLKAHEQAARGEFDGWLADADSALALVILLDQFPRNAFRGTARMYATDAKAREVARAAIDAGYDTEVDPELRNFFYLPLMHSEALADLERCVELTRCIGGEPHRYAQHHRDIVARFGRFPHRNAILGRASTPDEERFLADGGFSG
ncbi:DUF924 family protein [Ramlibacter sp.]|uniref:DUF924 family protein n=1 Tax=Ramlibacter sp. TaxID=1917967 RepID=UPI0039C95760